MASEPTTTTLIEGTESCTLEVRSKRGTGTRNEDRVKATLTEDTLETVEEKRDGLVALVEETMEKAREIQPDADADE